MTIIDAVPACVSLKDYLRCNLYRDPKRRAGLEQYFLMKVCRRRAARRGSAVPEMDDAGVTLGVMTGRQSPGMGVSNDDLMDIVREQPGRFVGIAGVDGSDPLPPGNRAHGGEREPPRGMEPGCGTIPCMSTMPGCTPSINTAPTAPSPCS